MNWASLLWGLPLQDIVNADFESGLVPLGSAVLLGLSSCVATGLILRRARFGKWMLIAVVVISGLLYVYDIRNRNCQFRYTMIKGGSKHVYVNWWWH